MDKILC